MTNEPSTLSFAPGMSVGAIATIVAIGGTLLLTLFGLIGLSYHFWIKHKRLIRDIESRGIEISHHNVNEIRRPRGVLTRTKFAFGDPEWNQLESAENIALPTESQASTYLAHPNEQTKSPGALNNSRKALAKQPLALRNLKTTSLSAVSESPQGVVFLSNSPSPPPPTKRNIDAYPHGYGNPHRIGILPPVVGDDHSTKSGIILGLDVRTGSQEELRPRPLFSETSKKVSPSEPRAGKKRARTIGDTSRPSDDVFGITKNSQPGATRLPNHSRSLSFGSHPPTSVPEGPVPPLPQAPKPSSSSKSWLNTSSIQRPLSRQSASSLESIGSSLLVGSPKVRRSSSARVRSGASRHWQNSIVLGPRPLQKTLSVHDRMKSWSCQKSLESMKSIHSCEGHYSLNSSLGENSRSQSQRNSAFEILQQCSQVMNTKSNAPVNRNSNTSVTPGGTPKRPVALCRTGSQSLPSPPLSPKFTGVSSTRSSKENPFQWDWSPIRTGKPSAMKGSPTARKGHRRQQCVRIAVPPCISRSRSPTSSMADILEEGSEMTTFATAGNNHRRSLPRPPSTSVFNPDIKVLRRSLTSSSPTLSLVAYANNSLEHENRNSILDFSNSTRLSTLSNFEIPSFPSPVKTRTDPKALSSFSFERPIDEIELINNVPEELKFLAQPLSTSPSQRALESNISSESYSSSRQSEGQSIKDFQGDLQPREMIINFEKHCDPEILETKIVQQSANQTESQPSHEESPPCSPKSQPCSTANLLTNYPQLNNSITQSSLSNSPATTGDDFIRSQSPEPQTPSAVRKSISLLRRMNSDARADSYIPGLHAARRYLYLNRDSSPSPHSRTSKVSKPVQMGSMFSLTNGLSREDSILEIQNEVDEMLAEVDITDGSVWGITNAENLLDLQEFEDFLGADDDGQALIADREDSDTIGHQEDCRPQQRQISSAKKTRHTPVSVWEDGETYWMQDTAQHGDKLERSQGSAGAENRNPMALDECTPIKVNVVPPSVEATPMSMYDASGFLKGY